MRRFGLLIFLVGCSSTECEYVATVHWSSQVTPDVTSLTVDGRTVANDEIFSLNESFPSYDDAIAAFRPRPVVVTTPTGTLTFQLTPTGCPTYMFAAPITMESDRFVVTQSASQSVTFFSDSGSCMSNDGRTIQWIE